MGIVTPDYVVPAPLLFPGGGTVNYAGVDSVTYPALPADGVGPLNRSGAAEVNSPTNYAGQTGSIGPPAATASGIPALGPTSLAALALLLAGAAAALLRRRR